MAEPAIMEDIRVMRASRCLLAMQRHSWEQGLAMQAYLELGDMDTVTAMALEAVNRAMPDGRAATIGVADAVTDPASCGEALLAAARYTGDPEIAEGERRLRDWVLHLAPRNADGILYHLDTGTEFWADSFYMLPPYLAAAGEEEMALQQFRGYWKCLMDERSGLLSHRWDDRKQSFRTPEHWGIGNGWCLMAVARLMGLLRDPVAKAEMAAMGRGLLRAVLGCRDEKGRFHYILDDHGTFEEVGIAQMCAYTMFRGIADGWLGLEWLDEARVLQAQAEAAQDRYGLIRGVCGAPTFERPGVAPEQQAIFLMMENSARGCTAFQ